MEQPLTVEEIIRIGTELQPIEAAKNPAFRYDRLCTTLVYRQVLVDGKVVDLALKDGRHGAAYVRVSTPEQRSYEGQGDGFSEPDQLDRVINFFVRKEMAFQIFSDCGLSGSLPTADATLVEKLALKKAKMYKSVFTAVFLDNRKYSADEIAGMREYMELEVARLLKGGVLVGEEGLVDAEPPKFRAQERKQVQFRPALTILLANLPQIHTLAITDMSRLTRSDTLFSEISDQLEKHEVTVEGVIESLAWINDKEQLGSVLTAKVLSVVSEFKIREVLLGTLRGSLARLESGRPYGTCPSWFDHSKDGTPKLNPEKAAIIRHIIELYLQQDEGGEGSFHKVTTILANENIRAPKGGAWNTSTITNFLANPALIGKQKVFGKLWPVYDRLIDDETWHRIREKVERRSANIPKYTIKNPEGYLMTGLIRCQCGKLLGWHQRGTERPQYLCRSMGAARRETAPHITLSANDVDAFFNDLMSRRRDVIARAFRSDEDLASARRDVARIEAEIATIVQKRASNSAHVREAAEKTVLDAYGMTESDQAYEETVVQAQAILERDSLREERRLQDDLRSQRRRLAAMISGEDRSALEKQLVCWPKMTTLEKNRYLKKIFEPFEVLDNPPDERMTVHVKAPGGTDLFPSIKIRASVRGTAWTRRLMDMDEYLQAPWYWTSILNG